MSLLLFIVINFLNQGGDDDRTQKRKLVEESDKKLELKKPPSKDGKVPTKITKVNMPANSKPNPTKSALKLPTSALNSSTNFNSHVAAAKGAGTSDANAAKTPASVAAKGKLKAQDDELALPSQ